MTETEKDLKKTLEEVRTETSDISTTESTNCAEPSRKTEQAPEER